MGLGALAAVAGTLVAAPRAAAAPLAVSTSDPGSGLFSVGGGTSLQAENGALFGRNERGSLLWAGGRTVEFPKGTTGVAFTRDGVLVGTSPEGAGRLWNADGTLAADLPGVPVDVADDRTVLLRAGSGYALWRDGALTPLRASVSFTAVDMNNRGQVAGVNGGQTNATGVVRCEIDGSCATLPLPPGSVGFVEAAAINDSGRIVGNIDINTQTRTRTAAVWDGGSVSLLPPAPGTTQTRVATTRGALNNRGDVIGFSTPEVEYGFGGQHPVVWGADGSVTPIAVPDQRQVRLADVNENGVVVGTRYGPGGVGADVGFAWRAGTAAVLPAVFGQTWAEVHSVNDAGQAAGTSTSGFRPVPWLPGLNFERPTLWSVR
ncbi:hypothetical protein ACOBQX_23615 [Actinokineospora sp. G85]|uniref:hypothetical protein n=1 Tax=Actinokineospora sp. G85 TaxID=3406626 RepID=UPI003C73DD29